MDVMGRRLILTISCIYIDFDLFLNIWLAGLAGWLLAAGWSGLAGWAGEEKDEIDVC